MSVGKRPADTTGKDLPVDKPVTDVNRNFDTLMTRRLTKLFEHIASKYNIEYCFSWSRLLEEFLSKSDEFAVDIGYVVTSRI